MFFAGLVLAANGLAMNGLAIAPSAAVPKPTVPKPSRPKPSAQPRVRLQLPPRLSPDEQLWSQLQRPGDRQTLLLAIEHSLRYLQTSAAVAAYRRYPVAGVTRDRVQRSLERFRQLLLTARSPTALQKAIEREFVFYQATGKDGQGTVAFTGYFEPVHTASRVRTAQFRYPIFRQPANLSTWAKPHPTRLKLEGADGLQFTKSQLKGLELAWLSDRLEAFLIQVQGAARLQLTDGSTISIGYAGNTDYPYTGVGRELVKAGKLTLEELTLPRLIQYFEQNPAEMNVYLPRNQRFIFFRETGGAPATGSLGLPVMPERSIATDKAKFPPGALALMHTQIPVLNASQQLEQRLVTRYVLDQDTGSAIIGAGRVDIFMGTGKLAGDRAGLINASGQLYYLLLRK